MFDLLRPCVNCPFRREWGERFQLHPQRLEEIRRAPAFTCHKTVDHDAEEIPDALIRRFNERYRVDEATGCWPWTGGLDHYGYGVIGYGPRKAHKTWKAHRLSWIIHFGWIDDEIDVLHSCDNRPCVNPAHLLCGDNTLNMLDAVEKGRRSAYRPLTGDEVIAMREEYEFNSSEHGLKALTLKYGCSISHVHNIVTNQSRTQFKNDAPQQCAGLMTVLWRIGEPNQMMRIAMRLGSLDPLKLDPDGVAYRSWREVMKAHRRERKGPIR